MATSAGIRHGRARHDVAGGQAGAVIGGHNIVTLALGLVLAVTLIPMALFGVYWVISSVIRAPKVLYDVVNEDRAARRPAVRPPGLPVPRREVPEELREEVTAGRCSHRDTIRDCDGQAHCAYCGVEVMKPAARGSETGGVA